MKTANIKTRAEAVTKDVVPNGEVIQTFNIPTLNVSVEARTLDEALIKAKALIKTNK